MNRERFTLIDLVLGLANDEPSAAITTLYDISQKSSFSVWARVREEELGPNPTVLWDGA
jgi:hypothetical protein